MDSLSLDSLAHIASLVSSSDLRNVRAVNRLWRDAIKIVPVALWPRSTIDSDSLQDIARAFPRATSLDLAACSQIKNAELALFPQLFPQLATLTLGGLTLDQCPLAQLPCLESLSLHECLCFSKMSSISEMSSLRHLTLTECGMSSLPEGLGTLSLLESLSLIAPPRLAAIPDAILAGLGQLKVLDLTDCDLLTVLPNSIESLSQLKVLKLSRCTSLIDLPEGIGGLLQLEEVKLSGCTSLIELPESIGALSQLSLLDLTHCDSLTSLPSNIGALSQLKVTPKL